MSDTQRTLVLIKPDAVQRGLIGEIISRLEQKGLSITAMQMRTMDGVLADAHYEEHVGKPFFPSLSEFMTSAPLVSLIVEGDQAIAVVRKLAGTTDGRLADPGTIRGDFGLSQQLNLIHASDSEESAKREIDLWFS